MRRLYLGLDLSMSSTGVAVVALEDGEAELITAFHIPTNSKERHGQRLYQIAKQLRATLKEYAPFHAVIKEKGFSRHALTTQVLYKVHGVSDLVLRDYAIIELPPTTIKKALAGDGKADKKAVEDAVRRLLRLSDDYVFKSDDASDAAGAVLAYLIELGLIAKEDTQE